MSSANSQAIVIAICIVSGLIVLLVTMAVVLCLCKRADVKQIPVGLAQPEDAFSFAKQWNAGYLQFGSNAYRTQLENGANFQNPMRFKDGNNPYATMVSAASSYQSNKGYPPSRAGYPAYPYGASH